MARRRLTTWIRRGALLVLFVSLLLEIASRSYLKFAIGVPFLSPGEILYVYYPGVKKVLDAPDPKGEKTYDVLILGPSVLHAAWGGFEVRLRRRVEQAAPGRVRIFNLSVPAHTTLDSKVKYELLSGRSFDLVVLYHGINDLRADACSPDVFRDDYRHMFRYEVLGDFLSHPEAGWVSFPFVSSMAFDMLRLRLGSGGLVEMNDLDMALADHGEEVKTVASFRRNLEAILNRARARGEAVILCRFAFFMPGDYSLEKFEASELDFGAHHSATEIWGRPEKVRRGLEAHAEVVKELAARHPEVFDLDVQGLIPRGAAGFDDICHLTAEGLDIFAEHLAGIILDRL